MNKTKLTLDESEELQRDITFFMKDQGYPDKLITKLCQVVVDCTIVPLKENKNDTVSK
jgi:hypothetical protein|tara:strand:- start:1523 stop:1696 length:174 start_codon:yes stop_codon:yes gene_type:complete